MLSRALHEYIRYATKTVHDIRQLNSSSNRGVNGENKGNIAYVLISAVEAEKSFNKPATKEGNSTNLSTIREESSSSRAQPKPTNQFINNRKIYRHQEEQTLERKFRHCDVLDKRERTIKLSRKVKVREDCD
jgi:hypothetical protein